MMAVMSGALYDALIDAGTKPEGRFTTLEAKFDTVKWMVGVNLTLTVFASGGTFGVLWRLWGR